jgi:hypothetical protein
MGNMMIFVGKRFIFYGEKWWSRVGFWGSFLLHRIHWGSRSPQWWWMQRKMASHYQWWEGRRTHGDTMRQLALVVSMLSHFVDLNSLWIWYELQKNRSAAPRETSTSFCKGYLRRAQVFSDCSILPS